MICVSVPAVAFAEGDETGEGVLDTAKIEEENCEYTVTQKDLEGNVIGADHKQQTIPYQDAIYLEEVPELAQYYTIEDIRQAVL